jgi:transcriptional regulator with XRE-family HTH domain
MKPNKSKNVRAFEDIDESFETPSMTENQQKENLSAFGSYRQKIKKDILDEDRLRLRLLRLKFQISQFLNAQQSDYGFSFFLGFYMKCLELNGKTFAEEINIKPSELSQILHNRRDPNERIMMRLEIHSNYNFPAPLWYEVLAKQKALELMNDDKLRKEEETHVQPKLELVI